jgi:hypothetical protein
MDATQQAIEADTNEPQWTGFEYPKGVEDLLISLFNCKESMNMLAANIPEWDINADVDEPVFAILADANKHADRALADVAMLPDSTARRIGLPFMDELYGLLQTLVPTKCSVMIRRSPRAALRYLSWECDSVKAAAKKLGEDYEAIHLRLHRTGRPTFADFKAANPEKETVPSARKAPAIELHPSFDTSKQAALDFKNAGHSWPQVKEEGKRRKLKGWSRTTISQYAKNTKHTIKSVKGGRPST